LLHSVTISRSKTLIFGIEVADQVKEISKELKALGISLYCYGTYYFLYLFSFLFFFSYKRI